MENYEIIEEKFRTRNLVNYYARGLWKYISRVFKDNEK